MLDQVPLAAVSGARLHAQLLPIPVFDEQYSLGNVHFNVNNATLSYLLKHGDTFTASGQLGNCQAIVVDPLSGLLTAVSDPRKDGAPAVV